MQTFSGWEYLLIDVANNARFNLDKETYDRRIQWATENLDCLEIGIEDIEWKEKPLYIKAVQAVREAQKGKPTGHLVGFDAAASGIQIMSAITGCESGCRATGLIDQHRRADAYGDITEEQSKILGYKIDAARSKIKQAAMTKVYGSNAEPKKLYGKGTPELAAFEEAMHEVVPGAMEMLGESLSSWIPYAPTHSWLMPDGCNVDVKNMIQKETQIKIDELNGSGFTYQWYTHEGEKKGKKNAANITHSLDAYVLRSLIRRCSYDPKVVRKAYDCMLFEENIRIAGASQAVSKEWHQFDYYQQQYERCLVIDTCILKYINSYTAGLLDDAHLRGLLEACEAMTAHKPFEIVTIHDDFKCHPNNMNHLRAHYNLILAALADSAVLCDILHTICGQQLPDNRKTFQNKDLAKKIKTANYAIC